MKACVIFCLAVSGVLLGCSILKHPACLNNSDCETGYYCRVEASDCHTITTGMCEKISALIKADKVSYHKKLLTLSNQGMNWFSAKNWCAAQGMKLVKLSDFNVSMPKDTCYFSSQKGKDNYCDLTPTMEKELRDIFGSEYYYWTQNSDDNCSAFGMCFINNYVRRLNRDATLRHAVCIN